MYLGSFLCEQVQISYMRCFSVSYLCCKLLPVTYTRPPPQLLSLAACNKIMIGKFDSHNIPLLLPSLSLALKVKWSQILSQQSAVRIQHAAKTVVRKQFGLRNLLPFFLSLTCVLNLVSDDVIILWRLYNTDYSCSFFNAFVRLHDYMHMNICWK